MSVSTIWSLEKRQEIAMEAMLIWSQRTQVWHPTLLLLACSLSNYLTCLGFNFLICRMQRLARYGVTGLSSLLPQEPEDQLRVT